MSNDYLIPALTTLVMISGAAERLVEMIKGTIPILSTKYGNPVLEARRKAAINAITLIICVGTALLTKEQISKALGVTDPETQTWYCIGIGVLSVGGSSFWNSILTWLVGIKDLKKLEATERTLVVEQQRTAQVALQAPKARLPFGSRPVRI